MEVKLTGLQNKRNNMVRLKEPLYVDHHNDTYKQAIGGLVERIFTTLDCGFIGYIKSTEKNYHQRHVHFLSPKQYQSDSPEVKSELASYTPENDTICRSFLYNDSGLGPLEKGLIGTLLSIDTGIIVFTGALGSGKSSVLRYVSQYLIDHKKHATCSFYEKCQRRKDQHIFFDFNGFLYTDEDKVVTAFYRELYFMLKEKIRLVFCDNSIIAGFMQTAEGHFRDMQSHLLEVDRMNASEKLSVMLNWIDAKKEAEGYDYCVGLFMNMLQYYRSTHIPRRDHTCFLLFFDNIDILSEENQRLIIREISVLNHRAEIKTVLAVRINNFNNIKRHASFNFRPYENYGISPIEIVLGRIRHYLDNKDTNDTYRNLRSVIRESFLEKFDERLEFIYDSITTERYSRLAKTLESLSGAGIRRGLQISKRLFLNRVIGWRETNPKEDVLIRCIYSYDFDGGRMRPDDHYITNLFLDPATQYPSLVSLRILNALHIARKNNEVEITIDNLIDHICLFDRQQEKPQHKATVNRFIEMLRSIEKRLLFVPSFNNGYNTANPEPTISISRTGELYLANLCKDMQYLQSCFEIIRWNIQIEGSIEHALHYIKRSCDNTTTSQILIRSLEELRGDNRVIHIPDAVDNNKPEERFRFLRMALRFLFDKDLIETINYKLAYDRNPQVPNVIIIDSLIMVPVIAGAASSVLHIIRSYMETALRNNRDHEHLNRLYNEFLQWQDFLVMLYAWIDLLFPLSDDIQSIKRVLDEYNDSANKNFE
ncbi:MAG: KAP family NTPase [Prevotella sp.]|jgi:hypothetical protein|nr:KAP family NTPase [Prevotella sp.]